MAQVNSNAFFSTLMPSRHLPTSRTRYRRRPGIAVSLYQNHRQHFSNFREVCMRGKGYYVFFTTIAHVPSRIYFARSLLACSGDEIASCTLWRAFAQPLSSACRPTDRDRHFPPIFWRLRSRTVMVLGRFRPRKRGGRRGMQLRSCTWFLFRHLLYLKS